MNDLYCIPLKTADEHHVATKAYNDVQTIVDRFQMEYLCEPVYPSEPYKDTGIKKEKIREIKDKLKDKKGSLVFVQYPTYLGDAVLFPEAFASFQKDYKFVYFIHDLNGLRYHLPLIGRADKKVLSSAYRIIALNERMKEYLVKEFGIPEEKVISYGFWDYLTEEINVKPRKKDEGLSFAGNLVKSEKFIKDYQEKGIPVPLHLYGYLGSRKWFVPSEYVSYEGSYPGEEIPLRIGGSFGLVWDGNSVKDLEGSMGTYQEINCPHKAGMYVISGLPLVLNKKAAVYPYVKEHEIGIGVNSLTEVRDVIDSLSEEDYRKMHENCRALAPKLAKGLNLELIIRRIISQYRKEKGEK